jgi:hypothetical protein
MPVGHGSVRRPGYVLLHLSCRRACPIRLAAYYTIYGDPFGFNWEATPSAKLAKENPELGLQRLAFPRGALRPFAEPAHQSGQVLH